MKQTRITLNDTGMDVVLKLADGNPGAVTVCMQLLTQTATIDPDNFMGGMGALLDLDTINIYGPRIWMLYKDVCGENISSVVAVLRAWQLGLLSESTLDHAIDNMSAGLDLPSTISAVQKRLPRFKHNES